MRPVLVVAALGVWLAACGSAGGPAGPPSPTPSMVTPAPGFNVVVTDSDRAVTVHAGDRIEVVLYARPHMEPWTHVQSSDASVLAPIPIDVMAPHGVTLAAFKALVPGTATISAYAGPVCSPGQACPAYLMVVSIDVTVVA